MRRVSSIVRVATFVRSWSGLQAWRERRMRGALILVYHGVAKKLRHDDLDSYVISQAELRRHVRYIKSLTDVIHLRDLLKNPEAGVARKQRIAAITFDDALVSQLTLAADVMTDLKVPWSIAVPAGLVEDQHPVWTNWVRVMARFLPADRRAIAGGQVLDQALLEKSGSSLIHHLMHHVTSEQRDRQIQELQDSVGVNRIRDAIMADGRFVMATWSQLRAVLGTGCEILSHGWSHRPHNSFICESDRVTEIVRSRYLIEQRLGVAPIGFAYPHGITSDTSAALLAKSGYEFALSTRGSWITSLDRWNVPRFDGEYPLHVLRRHLTWPRS